MNGFGTTACVAQSGRSYASSMPLPHFEPTSRPSRMFCDQTRFRSRRQRTCSAGKIPSRNSTRNQRAAHKEIAAIPADSAPALDYFWWACCLLPLTSAVPPCQWSKGRLAGASRFRRGNCLPDLCTPEQIDGRSIDNVVASSRVSLHDRCSWQPRSPGIEPGTETLIV